MATGRVLVQKAVQPAKAEETATMKKELPTPPKPDPRNSPDEDRSPATNVWPIFANLPTSTIVSHHKHAPAKNYKSVSPTKPVAKNPSGPSKVSQPLPPRGCGCQYEVAGSNGRNCPLDRYGLVDMGWNLRRGHCWRLAEAGQGFGARATTAVAKKAAKKAESVH